MFTISPKTLNRNVHKDIKTQFKALAYLTNPAAHQPCHEDFYRLTKLAIIISGGND